MSTRPLFTTKEAVERWLNSNNIKRYTVAEDLSVMVKDSVDLGGKKLSFIPVNFSKVSGDFNVSSNRLESLDGCPSYVGGDFMCGRSQLYSLEGGPQVVGGNYVAYVNNLVDLFGGPIECKSLDVSSNKITSLHNLPKKLEELTAKYNRLTDFEGFDSHIKVSLDVAYNPISSWEGLTQRSVDPECLIRIVETLLPQWKNRDKNRGDDESYSFGIFTLTGQEILPALIAKHEKEQLESLLQNETSNASNKVNKSIKI